MLSDVFVLEVCVSYSSFLFSFVWKLWSSIPYGLAFSADLTELDLQRRVTGGSHGVNRYGFDPRSLSGCVSLGNYV